MAHGKEVKMNSFRRRLLILAQTIGKYINGWFYSNGWFSNNGW